MLDSMDRAAIAGTLKEARSRTLRLLAPCSDEQLCRQVSTLQSPLVWDFAHIGHFEELWLLRTVGGEEPLHSKHDDVYDAFAHERSERGELPYLAPAAAREFVDDVRARSIRLLDGVSVNGDRLLENGFVFGLVIQHELQHIETMAQTMQLGGLPAQLDPPPVVQSSGEVAFAGGRAVIGAGPDQPWAYDNELPEHEVELAPYGIDRALTTNAEYLAFMNAGAYGDRSLWSDEGWAWLEAEQATAPLYWERDGDAWRRSRFGVVEPLPGNEPVVHVCFWEAEAFARWAGKRLPTEAEWEKAARLDPATGRSRRYPWGDEDPTPEHANLGQRHLRPAPVGAYPAGASPLGVHQLIGDIWEWTSSDFAGYPGFAVFPYAEYSQVFFGARYKVLRGGSFGTDPVACRGTFRNWDHPIRRQIFAGFRCARDARAEELG
jgi:iron(II)-dependent oxidoreductase